jgi:hypothetical protein
MKVSAIFSLFFAIMMSAGMANGQNHVKLFSGQGFTEVTSAANESTVKIDSFAGTNQLVVLLMVPRGDENYVYSFTADERIVIVRRLQRTSIDRVVRSLWRTKE